MSIEYILRHAPERISRQNASFKDACSILMKEGTGEPKEIGWFEYIFDKEEDYTVGSVCFDVGNDLHVGMNYAEGSFGGCKLYETSTGKGIRILQPNEDEPEMDTVDKFLDLLMDRNRAEQFTDEGVINGLRERITHMQTGLGRYELPDGAKKAGITESTGAELTMKVYKEFMAFR
jgi:hypothetical protein